MKQNLTKKAGNNKGFFFGYRHNSSMIGQNRHNWPDFFYVRERFFRSWARA